ncbi:MAG: hypothetical protein ACI88H_001729 [Cocleimonas sp.]|jgi:hypothetical protein
MHPTFSFYRSIYYDRFGVVYDYSKCLAFIITPKTNQRTFIMNQVKKLSGLAMASAAATLL